MTRETALIALRSSPVFRNSSVRLLADLVDKLLTTNERRLHDDSVELDEPACMGLVLEGRVQVCRRPTPAPGPAPGPRTTRPFERILDTGETWEVDAEQLAQGQIYLKAARRDGARVLLLTAADLRDALQASVWLARSVDDPSAAALLGFVPEPPRAHVVWLCMEPTLEAPLEALAQLLGASLVRQFDEAVAIVTLDGPGIDVQLYERGMFSSIRFPRPPGRVEDIIEELRHQRPRDFYHLLFVRPFAPDEMPTAWDALRFDRIVYLTSRIPSVIPSDVARRLKPEVLGDEDPPDPYFSSFIVTVVSRRRRGPAGTRRPSLLRRLRKVSARLCADTVRSEHIVDDPATETAGVPRPGWRLMRDLCRLSLDLGRIETLWLRSQSASPSWPPFPVVALTRSRRDAEPLARWARAVTNRQVGLALSGGGASSYRLVPLLGRLCEAGVPIDVVSGNSGGSLLGAYYCKDGMPGLRRSVRRGTVFQACFVASLLNSWFVEWLLDVDLDCGRVDEVGVRFVPLTTALRGKGPPQVHVIVEGTLGEAVRASGSMPGLVAPTDKNGMRYMDGAASTPVPARVLKDFGADIVFACNSIPGPSQRNPFDALPLGIGDALYAVAGRAIDAWVSGAFFLERVSREAARDAHALVEAAPQAAPLVETFRFWDADDIARDWDPARLEREVSKCVDRWRRFARAT